MFKPSTLSVAKPVVDTLTNEGVLVRPKEVHYPVGVMSAHLAVTSERTYRELQHEDRLSLKNRFESLNLKQDPISSEEYDELVELMAQGLRRMQFVVRNVIVPHVKSLAGSIESCITSELKCKIDVTPYTYPTILQNDALHSHVTGGAYDNVRQLDGYRTFKVEYPGKEAVLEIIARNVHTTPEEASEWAMGLEESVIGEVWHSLFNYDRTISPQQMTVFRTQGLPMNVDSLLVAYFITAEFCRNPQDVLGESVTLEEWNKATSALHNLFGALLNNMYQRRLRDYQRKRIVLNVSGTDIANEDLHVLVNGDVFPEWINKGGDVRQVLGAAIAAPSRTHAEDLDEAKEDLIKVWDRKYYMAMQQRQDKAKVNITQISTWLAKSPSLMDVEEKLPEVKPEVIEERVRGILATYTPTQYRDYHRMAKDLVCGVYYKDTPYREFLDTMDRVASQSEMCPREAALLATVELVAEWVGGQAYSIRVDLDIRNEPGAIDSTPTDVPEDSVEDDHAEAVAEATSEVEEAVEAV